MFPAFFPVILNKKERTGPKGPIFQQKSVPQGNTLQGEKDMLIHEAARQAGLSKKAVQLYLSAGLLQPQVDARNGYHQFTGEDVQRLQQIRWLRQLGFSVQEIRAMLEDPSAAQYYILKRMTALREEKRRLDWRMAQLEQILEQDCLSPNSTALTPGPEPWHAPLPLDETDAYLIVSCFLGSLVQNVELNEYRRFLWQRLLKVVVAHQTPELAGLRDYIYSLTPEHAGQLFALCRRVVSEIAALPPRKMEDFCSRVLEDLGRNLNSSAGRLKRRYECFLRPSIRLFDAEACDILREFTPLFSEYQDRLQAYCDAMLHRLQQPENAALCTRLTAAFGPEFSPEQIGSGQLTALYSLSLESGEVN